MEGLIPQGSPGPRFPLPPAHDVEHVCDSHTQSRLTREMLDRVIPLAGTIAEALQLALGPDTAVAAV